MRDNLGIIGQSGTKESNFSDRCDGNGQWRENLPDSAEDSNQNGRNDMAARAWAAGLFDGEGCVWIDKTSWSPGLKVEMTDKEAVERLVEVLGGKMYVGRTLPSGKDTWVWQIKGAAALEIVQKLLDFAIVKRAELMVMENFLNIRGQERAGMRYSPQESRQYEQAYWRLRELKQSGAPKAL